MKTIFEFQKGDKITRLEPAKGYGDRSYMGDELTFIGIANGQIYFKNNNDFIKSIIGNKLYNVALDLWSEGWDYYIDPKILFELEDEISIEAQIQIAIENEDYELADKLKKKLE